MSKYDDIINLPHHVSKNHPQMTMENRAAQFAPFAALTGYGEAVSETGRITDHKQELSEFQKSEVNKALYYIGEHLKDDLDYHLTYFEKDLLKDGGEYLDYDGKIRKIDEFEKVLIMDNGLRIKFEDIYEIDNENFDF